jgi:N-acetylmuramoyl-L-alanine amidase
MRNVLKIFLLMGIVFALFLVSPYKIAHAESSEKENHHLYEVKTEFLTMRTEPEEGSEIVGHLIAGNKLRTFEEFNGWVKTFYDGQPVWVWKEHLSLIAEQNNTSKVASKSSKKEHAATIEVNEESKKMKEDNQTNTKNDTPVNPKGSEKQFATPFSIQHASDAYTEIPTGFLGPREMKVSEKSITITKQDLEGIHIILDAGHGGKDSGAINKKVLEKNLTLATAKKVADKLTDVGANVTLTRENDTFISLANRVKESNNQNTDAFISLHFDYFTDPEANGVSTYFYHTGTSGKLAENIHVALMNTIDMNDRGVRRADYYVLANNQKPSVLIELGFLTNPSDLGKIQDEEYQEKVAKAITDGLVNYFEQD